MVSSKNITSIQPHKSTFKKQLLKSYTIIFDCCHDFRCILFGLHAVQRISKTFQIFYTIATYIYANNVV